MPVHAYQAVMKQAVRIVSQGTDQIHLSFDLDVADPSITPGVSTPVPDSKEAKNT